MNLLIISLTCIGFLSACGRAQAQAGAPAKNKTKTGYQKISAGQAHKLMLELEDFVLLDVRTTAEYKEKRIAGAVLIPDYEIKERAERELADKNKTILVYCRSGRRSAAAAAELVGMGYVNVFDFGGIIDWPFETLSD